jgi:hypothetical protein
MLEWCIAHKMKSYEIGQSSYEIKRRLGFEFLPLYIYSRPCNKLGVPLFKFFNKYMVFERFDPVFKENNKP